MKVLIRFMQRCGWGAALVFWAAPVLAQELPALRIDPTQITTSGISSGAFMAVQFGVAHSSTVSGVAATAGGPYFCALGDAVDRMIARCMQGNPIDPAEQDKMADAIRAWAAQGRIDPLASLANQRVWLFHGYNDDIVKRPIAEALRGWYGQFVPAGQVFSRNDLGAAHAQVSASCAASGEDGVQCNPCAQAGGNFINTCADPATGTAQYDAAGAALQWFYGPLEPRAEDRLGGTLMSFDQRSYIPGTWFFPGSRALRMALANTGYAYIPAACAAGDACRLHIAFHGCQQQAGRIGLDFVRGAGFNEWADTNRIVVLYPQTEATYFMPLNPQGCWDWWGYSDSLFDPPGRFATREGRQISAVWRMVERLRAGGDVRVEPRLAAEPALHLADVTAGSVALTWPVVTGAVSYRIERGEELAGSVAAIHVLQVSGPPVADHGLMPERTYRYVLHALDAHGASIGSAAVLQVRTAQAPPR